MCALSSFRTQLPLGGGDYWLLQLGVNEEALQVQDDARGTWRRLLEARDLHPCKLLPTGENGVLGVERLEAEPPETHTNVVTSTGRTCIAACLRTVDSFASLSEKERRGRRCRVTACAAYLPAPSCSKSPRSVSSGRQRRLSSFRHGGSPLETLVSASLGSELVDLRVPTVPWQEPRLCWRGASPSRRKLWPELPGASSIR